MTSSFLILIPPSEGKMTGGQHPPLKQLDKQAAILYERLMACKVDLASFYGVKGKALQAAVSANEHLLTSPTMPAIERYSGVVYDGIDYPTLSNHAKKYLHTHVRIVSALFGLIKPLDRIPDYKLKIEKLEAAKYWQPIIAAQLKDYFILDLLPQAHQKAVQYTQGQAVDFIYLKKGRLMPAGHQGKLIKGKLIRWLCENQISSFDQLSGFKEDGYCFDGRVFVKKTL